MSNPLVYDLFHNLMGARTNLRDFADHFIRAKSDDRILDIGCGTAQILDYLPAGVIYHGFDVSPDYIAAAGTRHGDKGIFTCKELTDTDIAALPRFDIVLASGVLHHMDDAYATALLALAHQALKPGGRLVTIDPCYAEGEGRVARFIVSRDRGQHVRTPAHYSDMVRRVFPAMLGVVRHRVWIPYTHWIMECSA